MLHVQQYSDVTRKTKTSPSDEGLVLHKKERVFNLCKKFNYHFQPNLKGWGINPYLKINKWYKQKYKKYKVLFQRKYISHFYYNI